MALSFYRYLRYLWFHCAPARFLSRESLRNICSYRQLDYVSPGMATANGYMCPYCPEEYITPTEVLLQSHIRIVHSSDSGFTIRCSEQGCERTFRNFRTYQNHLLSHRRDLNSTANSSESSPIDAPLRAHESHASLMACRDDYTSFLPRREDIKLYSAKWLLKTSETRYLTRTASVGIVEDVSSLIEHLMNGLKSKLGEILTTNHIDRSVIVETEELLKSSALTPFEGLSTFYQQMEYYKQNFNLIVSYINSKWILYCISVYI